MNINKSNRLRAPIITQGEFIGHVDGQLMRIVIISFLIIMRIAFNNYIFSRPAMDVIKKRFQAPSG